MPTFSNLTNGSSTTSFVTASVSPTVNRLVLVTVHGYIATGSVQPSTPTVTGNGITYTLVDTTAVDNSGTDQSTIWVFRGKLPGTSAGAITFSFSGVVPTRCSWSVDEGSTDIDVGGANAANAIVAGTGNKATSGSTVTTLSVSFVGSMTSGNGAFFACGIENNNSQTPEGTWTALANVIGTSLIGTSTQYLTTGTDTATATTWTTAARAGAILLEILAAAVVPPGDTSESRIYRPGFLTGTSGSESQPGDWPQFMLAVAAPFRTLIPYPGSPTPSLPGIIGYVEPEGHAHNPAIKDANDNLYRVTESDITGGPAPGNHPLMFKSTNGGITWTDMDSVNSPSAQDLEATWVMQVGTQIILYVNRDDQVWRIPFNTSDSGTPDTWGTQETVDSGLSSTGVEQFVSFTRPSNGQEWVFYSDTLAGANQQMAYRHRTAVNTYSAKVDLGGNAAVSYTGPSAVLAASDLSYVFYTDVTNAHLYYRTLTTSGTLSGATQIDSAGTSDFSGSPSRYVHTNGVYYDDAGAEVVSVMYADTSEMLKLVRIVNGTPQTPEAVSTSSVLCNPSATTSDAIIAHLAMDGTTILAIWSDAATGDLYLRRRDAGGTWDAIETLWSSGGNLAYYIYNLVFTRTGRRIMGYVYDVGDHPNDVSNLRYNELDLGAASAGTQFNQALNATLSFTSSQVRAVRTNLVGAVSFTSSQTRRVSKGLSAVLSFTGSLPRRTFTNLAGVVSFTSSQTRRTAKNLGTATLSFAGSIATLTVHVFTQALNASLSFTSSQTRSIGTRLAGTVSFTSSQARRVSKGLSAVLSFTGSLPRRTFTNLAGAVSFTSSQTRRTAKNLGTAGLSFTGSVTTTAVHFFTQAFNASLSFTGSLSTIAVHHFTQALNATLSFTGSLTTRRIVSKVLTATLSFTSSQTKRTTKVLAAGLSYTGSQTKRIAKTIAATLGLTGLLNRLSSAQPSSGTASAAQMSTPESTPGSATAPTSEAGNATGPTSSAP